MRLYVGVTDNKWFKYLAGLKPDEVNFWRPGGDRHFRALGVGEPFLFKLHSPLNFIAGGAFFYHSSVNVPIEQAWEAFGERNGVATFDDFFRRIVGYKSNHSPGQPLTIGCSILLEPFFFERDQWIPMPEDFSPNLVQGKSYDSTQGTGAELWARVLERLGEQKTLEIAEIDAGPMFGDPVLVQRRLGQGAFRLAIADVYDRRCAVSGERALPALEAAHIKGVKHGGTHRIDNGLLLRSDIHRLFDSGYVTVTPSLKVEVSTRLKTDWNNGEPYYPLSGNEIALPKREVDRPSRDFLEWHADTVYRR